MVCLRTLPLLVIILLSASLPALHAAPVIRVLEDFEGKVAGWSPALVVVDDTHQGLKAGRYLPSAGTGAQSCNFDFHNRGVELSEWDRLVFDYKIEGEGCAWWGVKIVDFPLGDGMQATWQLDGPSDLTPGVWHTAVIDLHNPRWLWGDKPDKTSQIIMFRTQMVEGKVTPILLDNIRLERDPVGLRGTERGEIVTNAEKVTVSYAVTLVNQSETAVTLTPGVRDVSAGLTITGVPEEVRLEPGQEETLHIELCAALTGPHAAPPLTSLDAQFFVRVNHMADTEKTVPLSVSTPLPSVPHPFALLTRDQVPAILAKVNGDPGCKAIYDGLKNRADSWLKRTPEFPDRGSQWWHWYTCKACGARLETKSPTEHVCPDCGKVYTGWPYDDVVLDRQHSALAGAIRDCGLMYVFTGNKDYAAKAREILLGYADRYLKYPLHDINGKPNKGGGHVGPQTLDESTWLIPVVQGFDCIYDSLSSEDIQTIADKLLLPAARLIHDHQWGIHNICCWHDSAYGLVGLALGDPTLATDSINGPKGFRQQIEKGVSDDGMWYEGAWGYHYYTMSALSPLAVAAHNIGIDLYTDRYKSMYTAPLHFMGPGGELPAFHDSGTASALGAGNLYEIAYARWKDPVLLLPVMRAGRRSLETLLYGAELGGLPDFTLQSTIFPAAGWAILRSGAVGTTDADKHIPQNYLALDFGPHGGGHGHPDKLSFVLYGHGKLLAEDPGAIAYGNPAHQGWYRQTISHNTVTVNGQSQAPCTGELRFSALGKDIGMFCAFTDKCYPGVRMRRSMALIGDRVLDVFQCEADKECTFDWAYHTRGALTSSLPFAAMADPPKGPGYDWAKEWRSAATKEAWSATWVGNNAPGVALVQAAPDGERQVLTAIGMGNPPKVKVPFVVARQKGTQAIFASAMEIFDTNPPEGLTARLIPLDVPTDKAGGAVALEVTGGGVRDVLLVNPSGASFRAGEFAMAGQGAALRFRNGRLEKFVIVGNTRVSVNGSPITPQR